MLAELSITDEFDPLSEPGSIYQAVLTTTRQGLQPVAPPPGIEVETTYGPVGDATQVQTHPDALPIAEAPKEEWPLKTTTGDAADDLSKLPNRDPGVAWSSLSGEDIAPAPDKDMPSPGYKPALEEANQGLAAANEGILHRTLAGLKALYPAPVPLIKPDRNPYDELSKLRSARLAALQKITQQTEAPQTVVADVHEILPATSVVRPPARAETTRSLYPEPIDITREDTITRLREEAAKGSDGKPRWDGPHLGLGALVVNKAGALTSESAYRQQVYPTRTTPFPGSDQISSKAS